MKSFKLKFALFFVLIYSVLLSILNIAENVINDKLTFSGTFSEQSLTFACIARAIIFIAVIVLSIIFARLSVKFALKFATKNGSEVSNAFLDRFFIFAQLAFLVYIAARLYFGVRELNVTSTALLIMGINDFVFELMLMRIFTYAANIIYALGGVCALAGCANYAKQLVDNNTKEIDLK